MADSTIQIKMDNRVKPGMITRDEILKELIDRGIAVLAANLIFDPVSGAAIMVDVNIAPSDESVALEVIAANPGVVGEPTATPAPLFILNLENLVFSTALEGPQGADLRGQFMVIGAASPFDERIAILGKLTGDGISNTFAAGSQNPNPSVLTHAVLIVDNSNTVAVIVPNLGVTATYDGAQSIALPLLASDPDMSVPGAATADAIDFEQMAFYIDAAGKVCLRSHFAFRNGAFTVVVPFRNYEDACADGAIGG